MVKTHPI